MSSLIILYLMQNCKQSNDQADEVSFSGHEEIGQSDVERTCKRKKGRGFQMETRKPFDEMFSLDHRSPASLRATPSVHEEQSEDVLVNKCQEARAGEDVIDEELEEILYHYDAELMSLQNEEAIFTEFRSSLGSTDTSSPWASLERSRRRKLRKEKEQQEKIQDQGMFLLILSAGIT